MQVIFINTKGEVGPRASYTKTRSDKYIYVLLEAYAYDTIIPVEPNKLEEIVPNLPATKTTTPQEPSVPVTEEIKEQNIKHNLSKFEFDLYHEEYNTVEKIIRVKRVSMPNKGEKWKVMQDNKVIFTIESPKISKKEKEYLETVEGFNFILTQAKTGIKSLNSFRNELKNMLKDKLEENIPPPVKTKKAKTKSKKISRR
jgi:hypothetical protein